MQKFHYTLTHISEGDKLLQYIASIMKFTVTTKYNTLDTTQSAKIPHKVQSNNIESESRYICSTKKETNVLNNVIIL